MNQCISSMMPMLFFFLSSFLLVNCEQANPPASTVSEISVETISPTITSENAMGNTISTRFSPPKGYERVTASPNTFAHYLQNLPLKAADTKVYLYNGDLKYRQDVHAAVIDIDVGKRDLQQCADAVMRLRAEHLFAQKKYEEIHFNFTNGDRIDYIKWRDGNRIKVSGNKVSWVKQTAADDSYKIFRKYMNIIFSYAGTLSLEKEMQSADIQSIKVGDVFIQGGSPGHAVIVVDVAKNAVGKRVFMLAQSYMPAQDIHVLRNLNEPSLSPWYAAEKGDINTPEWRFSSKDLKQF